MLLSTALNVLCHFILIAIVVIDFWKYFMGIFYEDIHAFYSFLQQFEIYYIAAIKKNVSKLMQKSLASFFLHFQGNNIN